MIRLHRRLRDSNKPANFQYDPSPGPAWYRYVDSRIVLPCEIGSSTIMRFDPRMSITCRQIIAFLTSAFLGPGLKTQLDADEEIGRASCRERVEIRVVGECVKDK